jgi:hypothetical protein
MTKVVFAVVAAFTLVLLLAGCSDRAPSGLVRAQLDAAKQRLADGDVLAAQQLLNDVKGETDPASAEYKEAAELLDKTKSDPDIKLKYAQREWKLADEQLKNKNYSEAYKHLATCAGNAVAGSALQVSCQQKLRTASARVEEQLRTAGAAVRESYARTTENKMLQEGHDMTVRAEGPYKETLRLTYVLINRPFVYQLINDPEFMMNLRGLGFRRVIFTDGYDAVWSCDVVINKCN